MIYNNVNLSVTDTINIDKVSALLADLAKSSLTEPGCVRFDIFHSQSDPQFFLLIEEWETDAHLVAHKEASAFAEVYVPSVLPLVSRVPHPSTRVWPPESS
jgi:quinol monooxygenase YgiN